MALTHPIPLAFLNDRLLPFLTNLKEVVDDARRLQEEWPILAQSIVNATGGGETVGASLLTCDQLEALATFADSIVGFGETVEFNTAMQGLMLAKAPAA